MALAASKMNNPAAENNRAGFVPTVSVSVTFETVAFAAAFVSVAFVSVAFESAVFASEVVLERLFVSVFE